MWIYEDPWKLSLLEKRVFVRGAFIMSQGHKKSRVESSRFGTLSVYLHNLTQKLRLNSLTKIQSQVWICLAHFRFKIVLILNGYNCCSLLFSFEQAKGLVTSKM